MLSALKSITLTTGLLFCIATQAATIELVDGTRILGEIKSLNDGVYVIDTPSLGQMRIEQKKVRSISKDKAATANNLSIDSIRQSLINSPETMKAILALQNDPQVKAILADPELMQLINSGNMNALQNNPKIQQLMTNPEVQSITKQILLGQ
ncbi:hypothetical protein H0A36_18310 [Endozoicomonas sp. SM1973]|uniref:STI1 domain-containing protein n=1 Tax=Spartinivicinus marinus TaxID=2994442 RepID=A0A853I8C4_9GAMM|nr:hypothetical protein [Spartinivicinus marinus]MCX4027268.1 hypothetical protein [Spartinivicinus marinus]NYZ67972.1 hypothetical protein [Spartinivicinus marinus]